jgi:iron complex transport system permease protein
MKKIGILGLATGAIAIVALSLGAVQVSNIWSTIFALDFSSTSASDQIIWQIRAPRIIGALFIGACLGIAGALAQGSTNNPLADPAFLGTTAGASLGVITGVLTGLVDVASVGAIIAAAIGAMAATALTFSLARSAFQLIIIGIALSATLSALAGIAISIADRPEIRSITFWSLGSLALLTWSELLPLAVIAILGLLAASRISTHVDLLSLGDPAVRHIGRDPQRIRLNAFLVFSILVAVSVSTVGTISFLALAAPHIARIIVGPGHRRLLIASAVIGASILLIADTAARTVAPPQDLPVGLLIALIAAPVLILVLKKGRLQWR